jgi:two-component system osmolarity sensor histidine kinase EnvZ
VERVSPRSGWRKSVQALVCPAHLLGRSLLIVLFPLLATQGIALELYLRQFSQGRLPAV